MRPPTGVARSSSPQQRRYRRFKLKFPVHLLFRSGQRVSGVDAVSRDVSIGGLLLDCPVLIPQYSEVNFVMSLRARTLRLVELKGEGRVVRVEWGRTETEFAIAVECKNPITQMEDYVLADPS